MTREIYEGNFIPITENGETKMYVTNAGFDDIDRYFGESESYGEMANRVLANGHGINEYRPSMRLNFDAK